MGLLSDIFQSLYQISVKRIVLELCDISAIDNHAKKIPFSQSLSYFVLLPLLFSTGYFFFVIASFSSMIAIGSRFSLSASI